MTITRDSLRGLNSSLATLQIVITFSLSCSCPFSRDISQPFWTIAHPFSRSDAPAGMLNAFVHYGVLTISLLQRRNCHPGRLFVLMALQHRPPALKDPMIMPSPSRTFSKMSRSAVFLPLTTPVCDFNPLQVTTYDSSPADMAERLTSLAYANSSANVNFNPRSVSLDIRSPEELAAVNNFLLTLGRDVVSVHESRPSSNTQAYSSYFDYEQLSHLGLTGMPGIPTSGTTSHSPSTYTNAGGQHSSQTAFYATNPSVRAGQPLTSASSYSGLYPSVHDVANPVLFSTANIERRMSNGSSSGGGIALPPPTSPPYTPAYHQPSPIGHMRPTPPLDLSSPHSSLSSPSNSTPPHMHQKDTAIVYDRSSRRVAPPAVLASADYTSKSMRTILPLKTIPARSSSPDDSEPSSSRQSSPTNPSSPTPPLQTSSLLARPLYPHIRSGDDDLKLPPLYRHYPPLSPPASPAREHAGPVLPSLREVAASAGTPTPASGVEERLSHRLDGMKLSGRSNDDRERHAALIRDLLVTINERYRTQFTPAPPVPKSPAPTVHDVEMPAARG